MTQPTDTLPTWLSAPLEAQWHAGERTGYRHCSEDSEAHYRPLVDSARLTAEEAEGRHRGLVAGVDAILRGNLQHVVRALAFIETEPDQKRIAYQREKVAKALSDLQDLIR